MQILATGNSLRAPRSAGFTLVEVLVALMIVGLLSATVVLTMPLAHDPAEVEVKRFMARLTLAAQDSVLAGAPTGVVLESNGYRFFQYARGGWKAIESDAAMAPVEWDKDVTVNLNSTQAGTSIGAAAKDEQAPTQPAIVFSPTGLATPFTISIKSPSSQYTVSGDAFGAISMVTHIDDRP